MLGNIQVLFVRRWCLQCFDAVGWVAGRVKKLEWWGAGMVICRLAYGPADASATHCLCFSKTQIGFTFLVPAHPGSPAKKGR